MAKKWTTVSTKLDEEGYTKLQHIAKKERKSESAMVKIALEQLFEVYPGVDIGKSLFASRLLEQMGPDLADGIKSILEKGIEAAHKEYDKNKKLHPKLQRLEDKLKMEMERVQKEIECSVHNIHLTDEPKKSKKGRPKKNTKKSNGLADLFKNIDASRI